MNNFSNREEITEKTTLNKKKIIILTVLILGWMAFIFYMSHQPSSVSSGQSGRTINAIINLPIIGAIAKPILTSSIGEFLIRKAAHMFLYFILGILTFTYLCKKKINNNELISKTIIKNFVISLIVVFLYACTDEIHQLFIPGRSGEFRDVMVDTMGGFIGLSLISIYYYKRKTK